MMFTLTIRRGLSQRLSAFCRGNGDAVWQIRRRFQQVRALHQALSRSTLHRKAMKNDEKRRGQTYLARGLPPPPPRATVRSVVLGQHLGAKTF